MAYSVEQTKKPMSVVIASNAVKELGKNLCLSQEQLLRANSMAIQLSTDSKLSKCDPTSIIKYCYEIIRYNFTRDDCAYPVPYGDKIQAQIGYKGFRELAMRSQKYNQISCSEVKECDKVSRNPLTGEIEVEFNEDYLTASTSPTIGFYAFAITKEGDLSNKLFMSKEDVEKHGKRYSKTYNSLWADKDFGFVKMAKKTVIKQLCNELDQTPELKEAMLNDQVVYGIDEELNRYEDNPLDDDGVYEAEAIIGGENNE